MTVGPEPESVAPRAPFGKARAHLLEQRGVARAVGLVQPVVERLGEEVGGARGERGAEQGGPAGREHGVAVRYLVRKRVPGGGGLDGRLGDERDRHGGCAVGDAGDPRVPGQADAAGERGGEVVAVALELDAFREELLRARACVPP